MRFRFPILLIAVVAMLALAAGCGGDDGPDENGPDGFTEKSELLAGIPQNGAVLGEPDAPVKIIEYLDLQCPVCKRGSEELTPGLITDYVKPGTASIEARPLSFLGPASGDGALGAYAAGQQNRMWEMLEVLFANQEGENAGWLDRGLMEEIGTAAGVDVAKWGEDYGSDAAASWVATNQTAAANEGATGVPFYVVESEKGRETFPGLPELSQLTEVIDRLK